MSDVIALAIATALATKSAEAAFQTGRDAWGSLVRLVRDRLNHDSEATAALETAQAQPDNRDLIERLAEALNRIAWRDPGFDTELRILWAQAAKELGDHSVVVNDTSGTVSGHLIQGRDFTIQGGLHLGDPFPPQRP